MVCLFILKYFKKIVNIILLSIIFKTLNEQLINKIMFS